MTIGVAGNRVSFNCDGVTTVFPIPLQAYLAADFKVLLTSAAGVETTLALNSDYSLAQSGTLSPTAWALTTLAASPYAAGNTLQAIVNPVQVQQTQYVQGQQFPSLAVQANIDRLTQMVQRLQDQVSRSLRAPDGDVSPLMLLVSAAQRALTFPSFDASGNLQLSANLPIGTLTQAIFNAFLTAAPLFLQTAAEFTAGVTPTNFGLEPWRGEDVRRIGAVGDGATDNHAALVSANSIGQSLYFAPGVYAVASNLTLTVPCIFDLGAILKPANGVTITINAPVDAGPWQIFNESLGGVISGLIRPVNASGRMYFEWWGAKGDNATDDTVPIQATLRAAATANFIGVQMLAKQYKITAQINANGTAAQNPKAPSIYGTDNKASQFTTTALITMFQYRGGSGTNCGAVIENVGFVGSGILNAITAIRFSGQCGIKARHCFFDQMQNPVIFNNVDAGSFTEFCVCENCEWSAATELPMQYIVGAGTNSFHGSGMLKGVITTVQAAPVVFIGAGARPYGAPFDGQVFYSSAGFNSALFSNGSTALVDFYGNLTLENLATGSLTLGISGNVPYCGTINCSQQNVTGGTLHQMQAVVTNSDGVQTYLGVRKAYQVGIATGANILNSAVFNQHRLTFVRFLATGYDFRYLLSVDQDGGGGAGTVVTLATLKTVNTAAYGAPAFTVNAAGALVATQAGWPASGVTCYYSDLAVAPGNETLEMAQI